VKTGMIQKKQIRDLYLMPCTNPMQANFRLREDGKKDVKFSNAKAKQFIHNIVLDGNDHLTLPCGQCADCRLAKSREWANRIMHEAHMYKNNCFITLTFDDEHLKQMCPTMSLDKKHMQDFIKRLRKLHNVRYYYCGEYGELNQRPHYHACIFNYNFPDKGLLYEKNGFRYFKSNELRQLWPYGNNIITDLSWDSAAYVARYCMKKINGTKAEDHYKGRLPEFGQASLKPGLGFAWINKYGKDDIFMRDEFIVNGAKTKLPRYYDKFQEKFYPDLYDKNKMNRIEKSKKKASDNICCRLKDKAICTNARLKNLQRTL